MVKSCIFFIIELTTETQILKISDRKQELLALLFRVPSTPSHLPLTPRSEWLQNTQTDTASLDSTVCVPAS